MLQSVFFHVIEESYFPGGGMGWFKINKPEHREALTEDYFYKVNAVPLVLSYFVYLGAFTYENDYSFMGLWADINDLKGKNVPEIGRGTGFFSYIDKKNGANNFKKKNKVLRK
jgi:hypothetical protein